MKSETIILYTIIKTQLQESSLSMTNNRAKYSEKVAKDLFFLLDLPREQLRPGIIKRLEKQVEGILFGEIKLPCVIYFSLEIYDYEGKLFNHLPTNKYSNSELASHTCSGAMIEALRTMRLGEAAWFNFNDQKLHEIKGLSTQGCHMRIIVEDFLYKNSDFVESKRYVSERNTEEGKKLFEKKEYEEALKKYRNTLNITENLEKKRYSAEELQELNLMNQKAKTNFLRCFIKLKEFDQQTSEAAEKYSKQLLDLERTQLHLFLRCKTLVQRKYIDDGFDLAKQLVTEHPNEETMKAYNEIKARKDKKK